MEKEVRTQVRRSRLTESQEGPLALINKRKSVAICEVSEMMEGVGKLIGEDYLQLAVSIYPWGAEFEVNLSDISAILVEVGQR